MTVFTISLGAPPRRFACTTDQDVLSALSAAAGPRCIRTGCRGGGCGVCKIRVLEGQYATRAMSRAHVSERDEAQHVALACRTYPLSDMQVEPLTELSMPLALRRGFMPLPGASHDPAAENAGPEECELESKDS